MEVKAFDLIIRFIDSMPHGTGVLAVVFLLIYLITIFIFKLYYKSATAAIDNLRGIVSDLKIEFERLSKEVQQSKDRADASDRKSSILRKIICHHKNCEHYKATDNCPVQKEYDKNENDN